MAEDQDSRTEDPTGKRVSQARGKGQVAMSRDVLVATSLTTALVVILYVLPFSMRPLLAMMRRFIEQADRYDIGSKPDLGAVLFDTMGTLAVALLPPIIILVAAGTIATIFQTGFLWATGRFEPNWNILNPFTGLGKLFSPKQLVEFGKGLIKVALVGAIAFLYVKPELDRIDLLVGLEPLKMLAELSTLVTHLLIAIILTITAIAVLDYFYQKWKTLQDLKMTKQEVKDEHKNAEGDPHIKGRMRQIRMSRARKRMMTAVPKASVVITNPTHFAVALHYEMGSAGAPTVVAKGVDFLARKIRELAQEHDVPIVENPPLARALYAAVEIDEEIPPDHYKAVAEIIGYVMRLKGFKQAS